MSADLTSHLAARRALCRYFASGKCLKGRSCPFLHVINIDREHRSTGVAQNEVHPKADNLDNDNTSADIHVQQAESLVSKSSNLCRHFSTKGWCSFGASCRFVHSQEMRSDNSANAADRAQSQSTNVGSSSRTVGVRSRDFDNRNVLKSDVSVPSYERDNKKHLDSVKRRSRAYDARSFNNLNNDRHRDLNGQIANDFNSATERGVYLGNVEKKEAKSIPSSIQQRKVCRFFMSGFCRLGQNCRFLHPQDDSVPQGHQLAQNLACTDEKNISSQPCSSQVCTDMQQLRTRELEQLRKRYPKSKEELMSDGSATFRFVFMPMDPDWPYDVKELNMEVTFPSEYPKQMMMVKLSEHERMPETVRQLVSESVSDWVTQRYEELRSAGNTDLMFRPLLRWLDKNAEDIFTQALLQYKRELLAKAAGVQFIPARQLRQIYTGAVAEPVAPVDAASAICVTEAAETISIPPAEECEAKNENFEQTSPDMPGADGCDSMGESSDSYETVDSDDDKENNETDTSCTKPSMSGATADPARRGVEVGLQNFQLLDGAGTVVMTTMSLAIECCRCGNRTELCTTPNKLNRIPCSRCHSDQLVAFRAGMAHQFSSVVGYLDVDGCTPFDLVLANSNLAVGCLGCNKEVTMTGLPTGQLNSTWCMHCHRKLTVAANSARFVHLAPSTDLDVSKANTVEVQRVKKAVKDPAIQEGKPLPRCGTCRHYKKSFRWLRFPCCGKAYPCDLCHNEHEPDHEMKFANRMICGFCAKEQPYSAEKPCISCQGSMTNKTTAHWEGGTGCRDKIKMSRFDSKKYANTSKTMSRSAGSKLDIGKRTTKLRHS